MKHDGNRLFLNRRRLLELGCSQQLLHEQRDGIASEQIIECFEWVGNIIAHNAHAQRLSIALHLFGVMKQPLAFWTGLMRLF